MVPVVTKPADPNVKKDSKITQNKVDEKKK